jgi:dTDP-4-dehydrorhamnose reductase
MLTEKSLVIGASGQIGTQIVRLIGEEHCIRTARGHGPGIDFALDLSTITSFSTMPSGLRSSALREIYCVGGMSNVDACEGRGADAVRANCTGPEVFARGASRLNIPFVYFSTDYVFDGNSGPNDENDPTGPLNVYGASKLAGEKAVLNACPHALVIRTTVVFGFDRAGRNSLYSMRSALRASQHVRVADDQHTTPTYNVDLARASIALMRAGTTGIVHVCGSEQMSRYEFARHCASHLGFSDVQVHPVKTSELSQTAQRPLRAGLISNRCELLPHCFVRTVDEGLKDWCRQLDHDAY